MVFLEDLFLGRDVLFFNENMEASGVVEKYVCI